MFTQLDYNNVSPIMYADAGEVLTYNNNYCVRNIESHFINKDPEIIIISIIIICRRHLRSFLTCIKLHLKGIKGNNLHLFKKYFKMMFFLLYKPSLVLIVIHFDRFLCDESFFKEKLKSKICGF